MSSMYLYCAFQSSEEFSALETSFMAISFFAELSSGVQAAAKDAEADACAGLSSGAATSDAPSTASRVRREVCVERVASSGVFLTKAPKGSGGWGVGRASH